MADKKQFVLSSSEFPNIASAEKMVTAWYKSGTLKKQGVRLYEVRAVYDLQLKFIKRNVKG
jgi:hypothetical protein